MSFVSVKFFLFLFFSLILYYIFPKKYRWIVLLTSSYIFYSFCGIKMMAFLLLTTVTTYISAIGLDKLNKDIGELKKDDERTEKYKKIKKLIVFLACLINFGILFFLKYWTVFSVYLSDIFGTKIEAKSILLPLGISFYMFQSIGYVIDVYRKKYSAEKNFLKFALFISFFPQIIQGPISRFNDLGEKLTKNNDFNFENVENGIRLMLWGYFKKLLIADRAAVVANTVFYKFDTYSGAIILFGVIIYAIQLYCDFSGGIDITRGVSKLFGIDLIQNFRRPIFATSLSDYWRRWHISLGSWMKDYVFYPISLSKPFVRLGKWIRKHIKGKAGQIIPVSIATFIVYFLIGIWHGANFKYIVFGFWNGMLITMSLLLVPLFTKLKNKMKINDNSKCYHAFAIFRTSIIVLIGRYITRAPNFGTALFMFKKTIFNFSIKSLTVSSLINLGITLKDYLIIFFGVLTILVVEFLYEKEIDVSKKSKQLPAVVQFLGIFAFVTLLLMFGVYKGDYIESEFIYKQF